MSANQAAKMAASVVRTAIAHAKQDLLVLAVKQVAYNFVNVFKGNVALDRELVYGKRS